MKKRSETEKDLSSSPKRYPGKTPSEVAVLWDESFLWGLMAVRALQAARLPFRLVRSDDLKKGMPDGCKAFFVPGGWASNKLKSLGDEGIASIRRFVHDGGNYLGFCGGAGLATREGIGLLGIKRRPTEERVPSFSGRIRLTTTDHKVWRNVQEPVFHAWWPSQFVVEERDTKVLASYGDALPDSFSSDLNVGDVQRSGNWPELERLYRINLDPARLRGEPAFVEGTYGRGKVMLSLIHFDTPGDRGGATVLRNLWDYLAGWSGDTGVEKASGKGRPTSDTEAALLISGLFDRCSELISLGLRNFLWFWRNPMLLQWRRGVRGLEYCTLYIMMKEIVELAGKAAYPSKPGTAEQSSVREKISRIEELLIPFLERAEHLLLLERQAMQNGHITYEKCDDPEIQKIRNELFSNSKSYGGLFKKLIDEVDRLLYSMISGRVGY